jgi:hypothetical protein
MNEKKSYTAHEWNEMKLARALNGEPLPWLEDTKPIENYDWTEGLDAEPDTQGSGRETATSSTWAPIRFDLDAILRGERALTEPTIGVTRSDGLQLFYPGKDHTVIGEMETGKSWQATACAARELIEGHTVAYFHYEEPDETDTVLKLIALGAGAYATPDRFLFSAPNEPLRPGDLDEILEAEPSLVIHDGVNEAMGLHGWKIREEDGAVLYRRHLVKPFTAIGATVISLDHVVKDKDKRGRDPLGSIHKGNGITGALILLEPAEPFGRGMRGRSHVYVTKDRPGYLRRHGHPTKLPGKTYIGELVIDDTTDRLELNFWAPRNETETPAADPRDHDDAVVRATIGRLTANGTSACLRDVRGNAGISHQRVDDAIARLKHHDPPVIEETAGARGARLFTVIEAEED